MTSTLFSVSLPSDLIAKKFASSDSQRASRFEAASDWAVNEKQPSYSGQCFLSERRMERPRKIRETIYTRDGR